MKIKSDTIETIVYIVIGIVLAFSINQGLALAFSTDMPVVAVESNSMVPTFQKGDILILLGVDFNDLKVNDIIVFSPKSGATPVVHRIIKINDDGSVQTKGDANSGQLSFETHIEAQQIHGKSVLIIPFLGWIKIGATEHVFPNIHIIIVGIIFVAGIYYLGNYYTQRRG